MRIKDIISEAFSSRKSRAMSTAFEYPDMTSANPYDMYRFSVAMADHTSPPAEGAMSNHGLVVAYTPEEEAVIKAAERVTGHRGKLAADRGSHEPNSTNTQSPVARPKKNRWGV
jgi:hypothetical protein